jgi:hypothetical protein
LTLLVIRVIERGVFAESEVTRIENWTSIGYKFQTTDARVWRVSSSKDTARDMNTLLSWSRGRSRACIVSAPGFYNFVDIAHERRQPKLLRSLLRTGILTSDGYSIGRGISPIEGLTSILRESVISSARRQGDLLVCPSGKALASQDVWGISP